jgi:hypothetical protein
MPQNNIFRWHPGGGWLILAGGGSWETDENLNIISSLLTYTVSLGPIAYVWAASDVEQADHHMDALRDLGARTGYLIDILTEEEDVIQHQLSDAGVIILGDGPQDETLRDALAGIVLRSMEEAFNQGATIYAIGSSASALGAYAPQAGSLVKGFSWLENSIILPGYTAEQADQLRGWVQQHPNHYGLGIGQGAALALGPQGQVEVWGNQAVTVSLGYSGG